MVSQEHARLTGLDYDIPDDGVVDELLDADEVADMTRRVLVQASGVERFGTWNSKAGSGRSGSPANRSWLPIIGCS